MITITFDYFENCILLQIITITDYDYPRSVKKSINFTATVFSPGGSSGGGGGGGGTRG